MGTEMFTQGDRVRKLIIQIAPTGVIPTKDMTPHVPVTPDEIAKDTNRAYLRGASMVHVHARDEQGLPTARKDVFEEIFQKIRQKCPDIIICATTSGRFHADPMERAEVLDLQPEMATLTVGSVNFFDHPSINTPETVAFLARRMYEQGVKPELEIFEPGFINTARYMVKKGIIHSPLHFNLLLGSLGSIPADLRDLMYLVESLPPGNTWSGAGIGRFQSQVNAAAILMGGHVRTGIEDAIWFDDEQTLLATNEALVDRIVRIARELGREIATPDEARKILGLSP
jgi:3-keto-5-aminohexanoate cleavage enzyme